MNATELGVVSWNILYDDGGYFGAESQAQRLDSFVATLANLSVNLDIVGIQEAENNTEAGHVGQQIARALTGTDGMWSAHSRDGEDIGLFGNEVIPALCEVHDNEDNRRFITFQFHDVTFAVIHFTFNTRGEELRMRQAENVLEQIGPSEKAVIKGDFNSAAWQRSRRLIERAGFVSVFHALGRRRPKTVSVDKYRQKLPSKYRLATKFGLTPDDIYVRDVEVLDAGVFEGDSDHRGVWAKLRV